MRGKSALAPVDEWLNCLVNKRLSALRNFSLTTPARDTIESQVSGTGKMVVNGDSTVNADPFRFRDELILM